MMSCLRLKSLAFLVLAIIALPLAVIAQTGYTQNSGQWHADVDYRATTHGGFAFLDKEGITLLQLEDDFYSKLHSWIQYPGADSIGLAHAVKFKFSGAVFSEAQESDDLGYAENYFKGNDPSKWASNVRSFKRLKYPQVYPGIDLLHYSNTSGIKHDFIVAPNADPSIIQMEIEGAERVVLKNGELSVHTSVGIIKHSAPFAYQMDQGKLLDAGA